MDVRLPAVGREVVEKAGLDDGSVSSSSDDEDMDMAAAQVRVSCWVAAADVALQPC